VNDLLGSIRKNLNAADSIVEELERSIMPVLKELDDIQDKIKNMEHIEEIAHEIENLKKKLAWAWVYDVDKKIGEQTEKLEKLRERIPACQERIDRNTVSALLRDRSCVIFSWTNPTSFGTFTLSVICIF